MLDPKDVIATLLAGGADADSEREALRFDRAALDDVRRRLAQPGTVVDLRAGDGAAAIALARAFPNARVFGFDARPDRVAEARRRALGAGVAGRVHFAAIDWRKMPAYGFDLVLSFDLLLASEDGGALAVIDRMLARGGCHVAFEQVADDRGSRVVMFARTKTAARRAA